MIYCQIETKPCVFYVRLSISLCAYGDKRETKNLSTWETVNVRIKNEVYLFYSTLVECPVLADDATF